MTNKRKPVRLLHDLNISEVSAVDKAAAPGARIVMMKRDRAKARLDKAIVALAKSVGSIAADASVTNKGEMLGRSFAQFLDYVARPSLNDIVALKNIFAASRSKNLDVSIPKAGANEGYGDDDPDSDEDERDDDDGHFLAGDGGENGGDEQRRRKQQMKTHSELMSAVVKQYGLTRFCKSVEAGDVNIDEHALCKLVEEVAKREGSTCVALLEEQTNRGLAIRKGLRAARDAAWLRKGTLMPIAPTQTNTLEEATDVNAGTEGEAYKLLVRAAEKMRAASPELSLAQAFERTFSSEEYRALANRERAEAHARSVALGGGRIPI